MKKLLSLAAVVGMTAALGSGVVGANASSSDTTRVAGANRYDTSVAVSKYVSSHTEYEMPIVYVASGAGFADGLAAGAQAGSMGGHLLLVPQDGVLPASVSAEIKRLDPMGIVIAGGVGAVSSRIEAQLKALKTSVLRLDGMDRYETAAVLSAGDQGGTAFVAAGSDFLDALAGSATAGALEAGLFLTARTSLPTSTREALAFDKPTEVVVLGGTGVVSDSVIAQIRSAVPKAKVTRVSGANRYATAAATSRYGFPGTSDTVFLASGRTFPDALAAGAAAGHGVAPLLLADTNCVPKDTLAEIKRLGATKFVAVGGSGVLSAGVINRVPCAY